MNTMAQTISMHMCVYECVCVCVCVCMCVCVHVCVYVFAYMYMHTHVCMYVCACVCMYIHMYISLCIIRMCLCVISSDNNVITCAIYNSCWIKPGIGAIAAFIVPIVAIMLVQDNFSLHVVLLN